MASRNALFGRERELRFLDDGVSGSILVRPGLERLRDQAAAGAIDRLYVLDPDRFSRKYAYQVLLLEELDRGDSELMDLDERIHRAVYRAAHNDLLEATLEQYYVLALRIWSIALDRAHELEQAIEAHRALLEAIQAGDGDRAADTMRAHVQNFEQAMHRVLLNV